MEAYPSGGDRPVAPRRAGRRWGLAALVVVAVVWSISGLEVTMDRLLNAPGDAWNVFRRMAPPAFSEAIDRGVPGKVLESVHIAWIGTMIGAVISLPLAFLAAGNVSPAWIRTPVRQLFNVIRAVPEPVSYTHLRAHET